MNKMIAAERRKYIVEALRERGMLSLKDIAKDLDISEITVRRDLEKLEREGKLRRVQGGATLEDLEHLDGAELTMTQKVMQSIREKERIAQYAAELVKDGDCVFIDGGTTTLPLVGLLARRRITIVTYNTLTLKRLANSVAEVFLIGGKYLPYYDMNVGLIAQDMLRQFYIDVAFLGCSGLDLSDHNVYVSEMESLMMKRIALENATAKYLLLDSSKFTKRGFIKFTEASRFNAVICDHFKTDEPLPSNLVMV